MADLTFTIGTPCAGGNHFSITGNLGQRQRILRTDRDTILDDLDGDEADLLMELLLRLLVSGLTDKTPANVKQKLEAAVISLDIN